LRHPLTPAPAQTVENQINNSRFPFDWQPLLAASELIAGACGYMKGKIKLTFLWGFLFFLLSFTNQPVFMAEDDIWNLIAKKLSEEASEPELKELEKLLRENPELHYPVQTIMDLWKSDLHFDQHVAHEAFRRHIQRMKELKIDFIEQEEAYAELAERRDRKTNLWPVSILALIVGVIFLVIRSTGTVTAVSQNLVKVPEKVISQITTKNGSKTNLLLPDGTKVWLNAGSTISYDSSYGRTIREVALSGEAFFDVIKNKERPFIIHASKINIKVLGTQFNVRSYPSDNTTEASLIRGSIEVTFRDKPNKKIILKPNEKIVVDTDRNSEDVSETIRRTSHEKIHEVPGVDIKKLTYEYKTGTIIETSWVQNKLIFQDEPFDEIARQLERWYGVSIIFKNDRLKENRLTGSFKNETIWQALDALKFTASFHYTIDNHNTVTIF
jgi:transmembrane sensor